MKLCDLCESNHLVERHHIFFGANRKHSEKYDLVINLCFYHHRQSPSGVHHNRDLDLELKAKYQRIFEQGYSREIFIKAFGRNYL